jgi:hypothetical protein
MHIFRQQRTARARQDWLIWRTYHLMSEIAGGPVPLDDAFYRFTCATIELIELDPQGRPPPPARSSRPSAGEEAFLVHARTLLNDPRTPALMRRLEKRLGDEIP